MRAYAQFFLPLAERSRPCGYGWQGKKLLMDPKAFVESLKAYDKDNIPPKIIKRIRDQYIPNEDFTPERVAKASTACEGLCKWICAMEVYDRVAKVVAPKKEALKVREHRAKSVSLCEPAYARSVPWGPHLNRA